MQSTLPPAIMICLLAFLGVRASTFFPHLPFCIFINVSPHDLFIESNKYPGLMLKDLRFFNVYLLGYLSHSEDWRMRAMVLFQILMVCLHVLESDFRI